MSNENPNPSAKKDSNPSPLVGNVGRSASSSKSIEMEAGPMNRQRAHVVENQMVEALKVNLQPQDVGPSNGPTNRQPERKLIQRQPRLKKVTLQKQVLIGDDLYEWQEYGRWVKKGKNHACCRNLFDLLSESE